MKNEELLELQRINLVNLLNHGAFQFIDKNTPWFPYTSGEIGPYFVQSTAVEKDGEAYAVAIESLVKLATNRFPEFDIVSGGETRDWDFSNPAAVLMRKPHLKLYKSRKPLGALPTGKKVLHIADLNNEGSSVRDHWLPTIKKLEGTIVGVAFFVDRNEAGVGVIESLGLKHASVVPLDNNAWRVVLNSGYIDSAVYDELVFRTENKREWALKVLRENLDFYRAFANDPLNAERAKKILRTYPEITEM